MVGLCLDCAWTGLVVSISECRLLCWLASIQAAAARWASGLQWAGAFAVAACVACALGITRSQRICCACALLLQVPVVELINHEDDPNAQRSCE